MANCVYTNKELATLNNYNHINDIRYGSFLTSYSRALNHEWVPIFLVHSNWNSCVYACLITELACSSLLIVMGLLACARALTRAACIANTLRILIAHYMFTQACCVHYLSSSNSPLNFRIEKHIRKGRRLILLVTGPAVINHLSTNYTEFYFCYYFPFRMQYLISVSCRRKPIKYCSSD